jgi:hypothetical protein
MKQFDKINIGIIMDEALQYIHIFSWQIKETQRFYLTKASKMLNLGKIVFKGS